MTQETFISLKTCSKQNTEQRNTFFLNNNVTYEVVPNKNWLYVCRKFQTQINYKLIQHKPNKCIFKYTHITSRYPTQHFLSDFPFLLTYYNSPFTVIVANFVGVTNNDNKLFPLFFYLCVGLGTLPAMWWSLTKNLSRESSSLHPLAWNICTFIHI